MPFDISYFIHTFLGYCFQTIPIALLAYAPYHPEEFKHDKKKTTLVIICFLIVCSFLVACFLTLQYPPSSVISDKQRMFVTNLANIIFTCMLVCMTTYYFISFKRGTKGVTFGYIVGIQYALVAYMIAQILSKEPFDVSTKIVYRPYGTNAVLTYLVMFGLVFPLCHYLISKLDIRTLRQSIQKNVHLLTIYSFMIFLLYIIILLILSQVFIVNTNPCIKILLMFLLLGLLLVAMFVYYMFYHVLRVEQEKANMQNQMLAFDLQYQAMNDKMQKGKKRIHDVRHHFRTLISMMENKDYATVQQYLQEYLQEWDSMTTETICNNTQLNSILNYYIYQAKIHNIQVNYQITVKDTYPFDLMDLTVLLGNALENAIEACANIEKPWIRIRICQKHQMLLLQIENSCDDSLIQKNHNNLPYSSKKGRSIGYGISNMIQVTNKYQGNLEYWKNHNVFTLRILLTIPEEMKGGI